MRFKEIPKHKFRLGFAKTFELFFDHHVHRLVEIFRQFLGTPGLNSLRHLTNNIAILAPRVKK